MPVRFLIAEDQRAQQKLLANVVLFLGGESSFASNGAEALQQVEDQSFDVVLMDLEMPEMGGLTAADRLLEKWRTYEVRPRIVMVSGSDSEENFIIARALGVDGFIKKPYSTTALRRSLQDVITRGYCWPDGPSKRLLNLQTYQQAVGEKTEDFECESVEARARLTALGKEELALSSAAGRKALGSLATFSSKFGLVRLQNLMEQLMTATAEADTSEQSEQCADAVPELNLAVQAALAASSDCATLP